MIESKCTPSFVVLDTLADLCVTIARQSAPFD